MSVMREEIAVGRVAMGTAADTRPWPVWWSAVWIGALSAVAMVLLFGLLGIALGAYSGVPTRVYPTGREFGSGTMIMAPSGGTGRWMRPRPARRAPGPGTPWPRRPCSGRS